MLAQADRYGQVIEPTIRFLQGREPGLARRIVNGWLQGLRFAAVEQAPTAEAFGSQVVVIMLAGWPRSCCRI